MSKATFIGGRTDEYFDLQSREWVRIIDVLCEGEIEGLVNGEQSIYLDNTPLRNADYIDQQTGEIVLGDFNFDNVDMYFRSGTQSQEYLKGTSSIERGQSVGVQVKKDSSPPVVTISAQQGINLTSVTLALSVPALFLQGSSGLGGTSVQYEVYLRSNSSDPLDYVLQNVGGAVRRAGYITGGVGPFYSPVVNVTTSTEAVGAYGMVYFNVPHVDVYYDEDDHIHGTVRTTVTATVQYSPTGLNTWTDVKTIRHYVKTSSLVFKLGEGAFTIRDLPQGSYDFRVTDVSDSRGVGITASLGELEEYVPSTTNTIRGKTTSKFTRDNVVDLTQANLDQPPWDIKIVRLTEDSTSDTLKNDLWWDSYTEIVEEKLTYPNTAVMGVQLDSTEFGSVPTRSYDVRLLKIQVPSNYDPVAKTYLGFWDGTFKTAWSDNPAWCFYDLATNTRYGLGNFISTDMVDKSALYTIGKYCDGLVPTGRVDSNGDQSLEPRFTCNMYVQTRAEAYKVITNMASIFRGMLYWSNNLLTVIQDSPQDVYAQFTNADVIDGLFNYEGSSSKVRHNVILVSWSDPENNYKQTIEYVEDSESVALNGIVEKEIAAIGCTSQGQARRTGLWMLYTELNETEVVSFKTGFEGSQVSPGKVIRTSDQHRAGVRHGGRISAFTDSTVTLDSDIVISTGDTITNVLPLGGLADSTPVPGTYSAGSPITVNPVFSDNPVLREAPLLVDTVIPSDVSNFDYPARSSLSADASILLIGSVFEDSGGNNSGTAHVYDMINERAVNEQKLVFSKNGASQFKGSHVFVSGDGTTLFISAAGTTGSAAETDVGAIFVFVNNGTAWVEQTMLQMSSIVADSSMGMSISCSYDGNRVMAGAPLEGANSEGATYYFSRSGTTWVQDARVTASTPITNGYFGLNVVMSADGLTSFASKVQVSNAQAGAVEVRRYVTGAWETTAGQILVADDQANFDYFGLASNTTGNPPVNQFPPVLAGNSLATTADGTTLAVGASGWENTSGTNVGAVYLFDSIGTTFSQTERITEETTISSYSLYGWSVSYGKTDNLLAVGSWGTDQGTSDQEGSVYVYQRSSRVYNLVQGLLDGASTQYDSFGFYVTLNYSSTWLCVNNTDDGAIGQSSTFVYKLGEVGPPDLQSLWVLTSTAVSPEEWRVISVSEESQGIYSVTALEYNASKYAAVEQGLGISEKPTSNIQATSQAVARDLLVVESLYLINDITPAAKLSLTWGSPVGATDYRVTYRLNDDNSTIVYSRDTELEVLNTLPGTYYFEVTAYNSLGVASPVSTTQITVLGLVAPPSNVSDFEINVVSNTSYLSWTKVADLDLSHYQIRFAPVLTGASWLSSSVLVDKISSHLTSLSVPSLIGTYMIKAIDTSDNFSISETLVSTNIASLEDLNVVTTVTEDPTFGGDLGTTAFIDLSAENLNSEATRFGSSGTKLYVLTFGATPVAIKQYTLATPYSVASAVWGGASTTLDISGETSSPASFVLGNSGTKLYVLDDIGNTVYQYTLSTAYVISTATYDSKSFVSLVAEPTSTSLALRADGTELFISTWDGGTTPYIYGFPMSTAWDISTASATAVVMNSWGFLNTVTSLLSNQKVSFASELSILRDFTFSADGSTLIAVGNDSRLRSYSLTTNWNILTLVYDGDGTWFDVTAIAAFPQAAIFNDDGSELNVLGTTGGVTTLSVLVLSSNYDLSTAAYGKTLEVSGGALRLTDPNGISTGTYTFANSVDLGGVFTSRITPSFTASGTTVNGFMSGWLAMSSVESLSGTNSSQYDVTLELRTTDNNPVGSPTWSAWQMVIVGDYSARAYQFRLRLTSLASNVTPSISELSVVIDMPDRTYGQDDLAVTGSSAVTYSPAFKGPSGAASPALAIAGQDMQTGDYYTITNKTTEGFTITFKDSTDTTLITSRTFDYVVKGYGYYSPSVTLLVFTDYFDTYLADFSDAPYTTYVKSGGAITSEITGDQLFLTRSGGTGVAYTVNDNYSYLDGEVRAKINYLRHAGVLNILAGLVARYVDTTNRIQFYLDHPNQRLVLTTAADTSLVSQVLSDSTDYWLKLVMVGTLITGYVYTDSTYTTLLNSITVTDTATPTAGKVGAYFGGENANHMYMDNLEVWQ